MKLTSLLAVLAALLFVWMTGVAEAATTSVTGTVVTSTSDRVVLNTPTGEMTFKFTPLVDRPSEMPVGSRMTVWYDPADTGVDNMAKASRIVSTSGMSTERATISADERWSGTSVSGTVVASTSDRVVLRTSTGEMTFKMSPNTDRPATFVNGRQVTVWYDPAAVPGEPHTHLATRISADTSARTTAVDRSYDSSDDLPRTAGPLPFLAWIGLAAAGGGLGLRMLSRGRAR